MLNISMFVIFLIFARIGLNLGYADILTSVWPVAGITLAAVYLFGYQLLPSIALGSLVFSFSVGTAPIAAAGIMVEATLRPFLGAYILRKIGFDPLLRRSRDVLYFIGAAGMLCCIISATIGAVSLIVGGMIQYDDFAYAWGTWFIGDFLGVVVIAPALLVWASRIRSSEERKKILYKEMIMYGISLAIISGIVYSDVIWRGFDPNASAYIMYVPLIFISLKFRQSGSVLGVLVVSIVATAFVELLYSRGISSKESSDLHFQLQQFMGITAMTFLMMSALVEQYIRSKTRQIALLEETIALSEERTKLHKLSEAKDEFIAVASHQLRTPTAGIKVSLGMLRDGIHGRLNRDQLKSVDAANEFNDRQIKMIDDLLSIAQLTMDGVALRKKSVNINEIISDVVYRIMPKILHRKQRLVFHNSEDTMRVRVDPDKFSAVVENIVDNASKYSPDGSKIFITTTQKKNSYYIAVKDQGVGIAKKDINKLFKKFSRIHNKLTDTTIGNGLGLYWSRKIIQLHGGDITVTSSPGKGSTFTIVIK